MPLASAACRAGIKDSIFSTLGEAEFFYYYFQMGGYTIDVQSFFQVLTIATLGNLDTLANFDFLEIF